MTDANVRNKILIVDDDPISLEVFRARLGSIYDLKEALSGESALEIIKTFRPAVVLLDVMMEGMDGYEVAQAIRNVSELAYTKIIFVSGKDSTEAKLKGYKHGADDFITKPYNADELRAKLNTFVRLYEVEAQLRKVNASLEEEIQIRSNQLFQAERLAFVGRHACDIVHNIKNPLTILTMHLWKLNRLLPENDSLVKMEKATDRILLIIKDILSATDLKESPNAVDVNDIVRDEVELLNLDSFAKQNIQKDLKLKSTLILAVSSVHIHQVIGNLVKNAFESLHGMERGKVTIATRDDQDGVRITISDTGQGITAENMQHVFDPLFTTKTGAHDGPVGNGLGLPYCKKMIQSYGGTIELTSTPGQGTSVSFLLPALRQTLKAAV